MSKADGLFVNMCREILDHGFLPKARKSEPDGKTVLPPTQSRPLVLSIDMICRMSFLL